MAATTQQRKTVSEEQSENIVLERPGSRYGYLGEDADGYHHHYDKATNTVYVTENGYERDLPDGCVMYWFRVTGDLVRSEDLDDYGHDLADWIQFVDEGRGWADRPLDLSALLQDVVGDADELGGDT